MIASFRMYEATPAAAAAWRALFARAFAEANADIEIVEHRSPAPIASLWREPALGCAFMCGWPFVRAAAPMQAIAAPVPSPGRYGGLPRYCSEFLVREDSGWRRIEDTFGHRIGWMADDSQSGFNAPRAFLAGFVTPEAPRLYRDARGPLGTPATTLDALRNEDVDVVALDGYYLDLVRHHASERLSGLRTVATTPWTPIPLLVAAPGADRGVVERLADVLVSANAEPEYAPLLAEVLVRRFVRPDVAAYGMLESMARDAMQRDYAEIR
jgi:ABC-type phosphate/phosphonate transport system substrate-binding protein